MRVQDIMTKRVATCDPQTNAAAAAEIMWNNDIGILPVVADGGRVVGLVTDRDLFIALGTRNQRASELPVAEVMRTGMSVCSPNDDIQMALKTMAQQQLHRLPVVDEADMLQGILSINDVARKAGADGLSKEDVAQTMKAICTHQSEGPHSLQRRPAAPAAKTPVAKTQSATAGKK